MRVVCVRLVPSSFIEAADTVQPYVVAIVVDTRGRLEGPPSWQRSRSRSHARYNKRLVAAAIGAHGRMSSTATLGQLVAAVDGTRSRGFQAAAQARFVLRHSESRRRAAKPRESRRASEPRDSPPG